MSQETSSHADRVRRFFDARVADYDAFYDPPSAWARQFNRVFRKAVQLRRDQTVELARQHGCRTVLDVGCGSGRNSVWFARQGIERVVGVDISKDMIEQAQALAEQAGVAKSCEFRHLDFASMEPGARFDMVVALGVFDYVEEPLDFLRHMCRFADKVVYGSFPGWTLVRSPLRKIRYALRGCPTHFYRQGELAELFEAAGFGQYCFKRVPSGRLAWAVRAEQPVPVASLGARDA